MEINNSLIFIDDPITKVENVMDLDNKNEHLC